MHVTFLIIAPFVEKAVVFPLNYPDSLVCNQLTLNVRVYLWTLNSVALICMSSLMSYHKSYYCSYVVSFEIGNMSPPALFFIVKIVLTILGPHMNFRISLSISAKEPAWILIGVIFNLDTLPSSKYQIV